VYGYVMASDGEVSIWHLDKDNIFPPFIIKEALRVIPETVGLP
jgi:hypothetical protein